MVSIRCECGKDPVAVGDTIKCACGRTWVITERGRFGEPVRIEPQSTLGTLRRFARRVLTPWT